MTDISASDAEPRAPAPAPDEPRPPTPQLRQIRDLAAQLKVAVPTTETQAEALEIYRDLLRRANRRAAGRTPQSTTDAAA